MFFQDIKKNIRIYLLIAIGIFIKFYHLNLDDLWWDEMLSFWVSNPEINFEKTINRNIEVNLGSQLIFSFLLKIFFNIFGYNLDIARYLTIFIGILNIPLLIILVRKIRLEKSIELILVLFLFNSYLISYDYELRSYALFVLISLLSLIYFYDLLEKRNNKYLIIVSFINLIGILNHTFYGIIIFSQFIFLLINKNKFLIKYCYFQFFISILFIMISKEALIAQVTFSKMWYPKIGPGFLVDFY